MYGTPISSSAVAMAKLSADGISSCCIHSAVLNIQDGNEQRCPYLTFADDVRCYAETVLQFRVAMKLTTDSNDPFQDS